MKNKHPQRLRYTLKAEKWRWLPFLLSTSARQQPARCIFIKGITVLGGLLYKKKKTQTKVLFKESKIFICNNYVYMKLRCQSGID